MSDKPEPWATVEAIFHDRRMSLEKIEELGFRGWGGTGGWYGFERSQKEPHKLERFSPPYWIKQMIHDAFDNGQESVRHELREAMGVPHPRKPRKKKV